MTTTPQPRTPQGNPHKPRSPSRKAWVIVPVALVAAGVLVFQVFAGLSDGKSGLDDDAKLHGQAASDAADRLVRQSTGTFATISAGAAGCSACNATAGVDAQVAELEAKIAELEAALAAATAATGVLPDVPVGWLPGSDVTALVGDVAAGSFPLPGFPDGIDAAATLDASWKAIEALVQDGDVVVPPTGNAQADALLQQAVALYWQAYALLHSAETQAVWDTLATTPLGGVGILQDPHEAGGAVQPDEDGALLAQDHAGNVLDAAFATGGSLETGLEAILAFEDDLVQAVLALVDEIEDLRDATEASLMAAADARVRDAQRTLRSTVANLQAEVNRYTAHLDATVDGMKAELDALVAAQAEAAVAQAEATVAAIQAEIDGVQADVERRTQAVVAHSTAAIAELEALAAGSGLDFTGQVATVQAAADQAVADIQATGTAKLSELQAQADAVVAQAEGAAQRLQSMADAAVADAQATVDGAIDSARAMRDFGVALATAETDALLASIEDRLGEAYATLNATASASQEMVVESAYAFLDDTEGLVGGVDGLLDQVAAQSMGHVGADVDYILEVVEDYANVPTPDRQARADHWAGVAELLTGTLDGALGQVGTLEDLVMMVLQSADEARAGLDIAASLV